jgi:hypothetical protein
MEFRKRYQIPSYYPQMSILIQELVQHDYGFMISCPSESTQVNIEIQVGAWDPKVEGNPFKMTYDLQRNCLEFQSFSDKASCRGSIIDYTEVDLSSNPKKLEALGLRLG